MTDEQVDAEPRTEDPLDALLDEPLTELTVDDLMALKAELKKRGAFYNRLLPRHFSIPELVALVTPVAIYSKAFLETLAKHHADAFADLLRRSFRKNGTTAEAEIGLDGDAAAKIVVTADMPDEARLALLDLDVTDDAVRGKLLRWDGSASAWRPADDK